MCLWNTHTYDCGCLTPELRDRCKKKREDDEIDPCFEMQAVKEKWRTHQHRLCDECMLKKGVQRVGVLSWEMICTRAQDEAVRAARTRRPRQRD